MKKLNNIFVFIVFIVLVIPVIFSIPSLKQNKLNSCNSWTRTYSAPGGWNTVSVAYDIAVDNELSVYVTGKIPSSDNLPLDSVYGADSGNAVLLKYDKCGNLLWTVIFDTPTDYFSVDGIYYASGENDARGVAVDNKGGVYVVGNIAVNAGPPTLFGSNSADGDIWLAKYNSSDGTLIWSRNYGSDYGVLLKDEEGFDITLDPSENYFYITGSSIDTIFTNTTFVVYGTVMDYIIYDRDILTAKFKTSNGNLVWARRFNALLDDRYGSGITVDPSSNVYVSAQERLLKYNSKGKILWNTTFPAVNTGISFDSVNNFVYVIGGTGFLADNLWFGKFSTSGSLLFSETSSVDSAGNDIHASGDVISYTGSIWGALGDEAILVVRRNLEIGAEWSDVIGGINSNSAAGNSIAVDSSNNIYVAGFTVDEGFEPGIWIRKYSSFSI